MVESWQQWEGRIVNGEFPLRKYLGGSEHSAVYLTEIQGVRTAIKLIPADAPHAQARVARWKLAVRLSHPNLVRILKTGLWHADDEHDMLFAIMEYCEENLAQVLRQRPLTPAETRDLLLPALDALHYLHAQDILHGRIKPANILAVADQLKLSSDGVHRTGEVEYSNGAGPYDAPEKAMGTISPSSDIWSLGVTLVEVLTNRLPERDKNDHPELMEKLSPPFDGIVKGCLTLDPERRLSVTAIRDLLGRATAEAETEAGRDTRDQSRCADQATSSSDERMEPAYGSNSAAVRSSSPEKSAAGPGGAGNRRLLFIAAIVFVILAIAIGLRQVHHSSGTSQPAAPIAARQDSATGGPAATSAGAAACQVQRAHCRSWSGASRGNARGLWQGENHNKRHD